MDECVMGYWPQGDTQAQVFAMNLATYLQGSPAKYGLTPIVAEDYMVLAQTYATKLSAARNEGTRTRGSIAAKDEAKEVLRRETTRVVRLIRAQTALTDQDLLDLGLQPIKAREQVQREPTGTPIVTAAIVGPRSLNVRLRDGLSGRRALPSGVKGASLFVFVGDEAPTDPAAWTYAGSATRTTCQLDVSAYLGEAAGTVHLCAFWFNGKAQSGVASDPVTVDLPACRARPVKSSVETRTMRVAA
jgi:hypothetical protein